MSGTKAFHLEKARAEDLEERGSQCGKALEERGRWHPSVNSETEQIDVAKLSQSSVFYCE